MSYTLVLPRPVHVPLRGGADTVVWPSGASLSVCVCVCVAGWCGCAVVRGARAPARHLHGRYHRLGAAHRQGARPIPAKPPLCTAGAPAAAEGPAHSEHQGPGSAHRLTHHPLTGQGVRQARGLRVSVVLVVVSCRRRTWPGASGRCRPSSSAVTSTWMTPRSSRGSSSPRRLTHRSVPPAPQPY